MNAGARSCIWAIVYEKPARYDVVLAAKWRLLSVRPSVGLAEAHDHAPETASREARRRSYLFAPRGGLVMALPDSLP